MYRSTAGILDGTLLRICLEHSTMLTKLGNPFDPLDLKCNLAMGQAHDLLFYAQDLLLRAFSGDSLGREDIGKFRCVP